jgi:glycosyltransferase involved in cell wall biosynthesis
MTARKPKIAVIGLKGLPAYGGASAVGENIKGRLKDDYDFTILSVASHTTRKTGYVNGIRQIVFKNHGRSSLNTLIYYWKCLFHCLFHNYDLIQLHHGESGFITPLLRLKYKVIVTFHGVCHFPDPKFSGLHNWFFRHSEKLNVKFANEIISVSKPDQNYILEKYKKEIRYIPNGILLNDELNSILNKKSPKDYLLFAAGRIYQIKGLHLLLEAAKKINLQTEIKIAGDIDQVNSYKLEVEKLAEGLNTKYLGLIKNKSDLMKIVAEAKLFVFPSLTEAMSMMLLEVVSMKTPVIASDIPSNKAVFSDEEVLFFRNNDTEDLAQKLRFAIDNPILMSQKAEKAFDKLVQSYSWEIISEQYKEIYDKYLSR